MPSRVITLPMPEAGAERDFMYRRPHNCKNAKAFRSAMGDRDIDMLYFNVGSHGEGMPSGQPFPVRATYPCGVCGEYPGLWFEWKSPGIVILGR